MHEALAGVLLELLRELAAKNNVHLNVGKTDLPDNPVTVIADDEGPQPIEVTSRLLAHMARRIPGIKKLEKMAEGRDIKAGPMSDLGTLFAQLYARNKAQIDNAASDAVMEKVFHKQPHSQTGGVVLDFGTVQPPGSNNNNGGSQDA